MKGLKFRVPAMGRLTLFTAAFAVSCLAGSYLPLGIWVLPLGGGTLAAACLWCWKRGRGKSAAFLLGLALGFLWFGIYGLIFHAPAERMENRTVRLEAVAVAWPQKTDYGYSLLVKAGEENGRKVKAMLYADEVIQDVRPGDTISSIAHCKSVRTIHGEETLYYTAKGIYLRIFTYGQVTVTKKEGFPPRYLPVFVMKKFQDTIDRLYPSSQANFLRGLLTGDKSGMTDEMQNSFSRVGVSHVVVISGLHIAFLVGVLKLVFGVRRKSSLFILVCVTFFFAAMTGNAPGTIRAAILCTMALAAPFLDRRYDPITALSAALFVLLAVNPNAIANAGLQFSFLAVLGIYWFGQPLSDKWRKRLPGRKIGKKLLGIFTSTFAVSVGAMVFTLPLSALYFGHISLIAPFSNMATEWAVSLGFLGGILSVCAGLIFFPAGQVLALLTGLPVRFFLWSVSEIARIPFADVTLDSVYYLCWLVFLYAIFCLYMLWKPEERRPVIPLCACAAAFCVAAILTNLTLRAGDLTLSVLDVGQGESVALTSGGYTALVDCGGSKDAGNEAAGYIQALGTGRLDLLVLTHFHEDHAGGVPELMSRVSVGAIALPDVDEENPLRQEIEGLAASKGTKLWYITQDTEVTLGRAVLTIYAPLGGGEVNEEGLTILCTAGDWDALMTGDMGAETEELLIQREALPDIELLVVGHHGSRYSTCGDFLKAVKPEIGVISVGENTYGQPAQETLDRLKDAGVTVYRTDETGTVTVFAGEEKQPWRRSRKRTMERTTAS